jgi:hypothetical protein
VSDLTDGLVEKGDIQGLLLTGLATEKTVSLMTNYLENTGDLQSVVLLLSSNEASVSRLIIPEWVETYYHFFN